MTFFDKFNPDSVLHIDCIGEFPDVGLVVSKKTSQVMWNLGDTKPVCTFKTRLNVLEWLGDGPKLTPIQALE